MNGGADSVSGYALRKISGSVIKAVPRLAAVTGSWYDPDTSGQGLILHSMSDEKMVVSFFGYNNGRERIWLIGLYTGQITWSEPLEMT